MVRIFVNNFKWLRYSPLTSDVYINYMSLVEIFLGVSMCWKDFMVFKLITLLEKVDEILKKNLHRFIFCRKCCLYAALRVQTILELCLEKRDSSTNRIVKYSVPHKLTETHFKDRIFIKSISETSDWEQRNVSSI